MGTLKLLRNGLLYSNTVIDTLAVDGWAVTFGTARRGLGGLWPHTVPSLLYHGPSPRSRGSARPKTASSLILRGHV